MYSRHRLIGVFSHASGPGSEPQYVETRKAEWSTGELSLPWFEETEVNAKRGAGVVGFLLGLFSPLLGGFWTGIFFAYLSYSAATGELGNYQRRNDFGSKYADTSDEIGKALTQGGMLCVKTYNWASLEIQKKM